MAPEVPARRRGEGGDRLAAEAEVDREVAGPHRWRTGSARWLTVLFTGVLLPLTVFIVLVDAIGEGEALPVDTALLMWMQARASPALDGFFVVVSRFGYEWGVIPLDLLLVAGLLWRRRWRDAAFAATALAGAALLNLGSKQLFQRVRPDLWESIAPESTFSFPSGHAMGAMALALTLVLLAWPTRWRHPVVLFAVVFVALVGISRVYLGVHFPSDILAGWCAALAWVLGMHLLMYRWRRSGPDG